MVFYLRWEASVCFVDIGGIVDQYCLRFLFIATNQIPIDKPGDNRQYIKPESQWTTQMIPDNTFNKNLDRQNKWNQNPDEQNQCYGTITRIQIEFLFAAVYHLFRKWCPLDVYDESNTHLTISISFVEYVSFLPAIFCQIQSWLWQWKISP